MNFQDALQPPQESSKTPSKTSKPSPRTPGIHSRPLDIFKHLWQNIWQTSKDLSRLMRQTAEDAILVFTFSSLPDDITDKLFEFVVNQSRKWEKQTHTTAVRVLAFLFLVNLPPHSHLSANHGRPLPSVNQSHQTQLTHTQMEGVILLPELYWDVRRGSCSTLRRKHTHQREVCVFPAPRHWFQHPTGSWNFWKTTDNNAKKKSSIEQV